MTEIQKLLSEVSDAGATLRTDGTRLTAVPRGVLSERLKSLLRDRKPEIIDLLSRQQAELQESHRRLEDLDIRVAIFVTEIDGRLVITSEQLIQGEASAHKAWMQGAVVFTADEMHCFVNLSAEERRLFLSLKMIKQSKKEESE